MIPDEISTITINKKSEDELSDEVLRISTGPWGLHSLINEFETWITEILGVEQMQDFKTKCSCDFEEVIENFLNKFKKEHPGGSKYSKTVNMKIPGSLINRVKGLSNYPEGIHFISDTMKWKKNVFFKFGENITKRVITHVKKVLADDMEDVDTILLFGSLSECIVVQNEMRESFKTKRFVPLHENEVVKGAVYIGHMLQDI